MAALAELTRKAINGSHALRAAADRSLAQEMIQAQRAARLLAPARRFAINQRHRGDIGCYRMRSSGVVVRLRHRTRDVAIFNEIFAAGLYEPPAGLRLGGALRVLDVGANIGLFGLFALGRWDVSRMQSYEPDPANASLLRANAAHQPDSWRVVEAAVSNRNGWMRFMAGEYSESREAAADEAGVRVRVTDLFAEAKRVDLLKIDVEGGEWAILEDPRLSALDVEAIVMEWHERRCRDARPGGYAAALLSDAGFVHQHEMPGPNDSNGLLWAWR